MRKSEEKGSKDTSHESASDEVRTISSSEGRSTSEIDDDVNNAVDVEIFLSSERCATSETEADMNNAVDIEIGIEKGDTKIVNAASIEVSDSFGEEPSSERDRMGSQTGLSERSQEAAKWAHNLPYWTRPAFQGLFNLLQAIFSAAALMWLDASIIMMLSSGLRILLITLASKFIRKRAISKYRWAGSWIVVVGIVLVGTSSVAFFRLSEPTASKQWIGIGFVVADSLVASARDITGEVFMQETNFPPLLLLGISGCWSFLFGVPLYIAIGPLLGFNPSNSLRQVWSSPFFVWYIWVFVLITWFSNLWPIQLNGLTSSLSFNVWKNVRGLVTWVAALAIYYGVGRGSTLGKMGEPWIDPQSWLVLAGYAAMTVRVFVYYRSTGSNT